MKIAMIGLRGIPGKSGGVENTVENLAPRLVRLGCDITVYCRPKYCASKPKIFKGVHLKYLPTINTKYTESVVHSTISTANALFKDYDIVHYHAMGNGVFSIIPRIKGDKTIITLHGLDWEREKWGFAAKTFLKISEKLICRFPSKVIAVSDKIKKYYKKKYDKNIFYIPNGVDIKAPKKLNHLKRFGLEKEKYILFLSRLVPEKGVHVLINAYKKTKTDVKLVIVGDSTHTQGYCKKIKESAKDDKRIIFTGALYDDDKAEAFSNCLFFVLPSTIEGMPIVLLEAMSYGKCPLVSDIEENVDVIKDCGFSFKVNDERDLQKMLRYMINQKNLLDKKGRECKELVKTNYDWDVIAQKTYEVYEDALSGKKH